MVAIAKNGARYWGERGTEALRQKEPNSFCVNLWFANFSVYQNRTIQ